MVSLCIALVAMSQLLNTLVTAVTDMHIAGIPHCLVAVDDYQVKADRVAPENPDRPGDVNGVNWERDHVKLVEASDGSCTTELQPSFIANYITPRGHYVDLVRRDSGVASTEWVADSEGTGAVADFSQLIAVFLSGMPALLILFIYSVGLLMIRGTALAPVVDLSLYLGIAIGLFGMRLFGMLDVFDHFDGSRYEVFSYGIGVVGPIAGNFWTTMSVFTALVIAMMIFRSHSSSYTYNRP